MSKFILNIRPDEDAARDIATLTRHNVAALSSPVMTICPVKADFGDPNDSSGLIFTSRHAVVLFAAEMTSISTRQDEFQQWRNKPVYVVGSATARAARAAGFQCVKMGTGGGASLVPIIAGHHKAGDGPLLWPSAIHKSFDMAAALSADGYQVDDQPLYETTVANHLSAETVSAIEAGEILAVLSLSARTSQLFVHLLKSHDLWHRRSSIIFIAGSQAIADAAASGWKEVFVARHPRRTRLLAIATFLFRRHLQDDAPQGTL